MAKKTIAYNTLDMQETTPNTPPLAAGAESSKKVDPYEELAKEYAKHYPDNKTFYITTDKQVFLGSDRNLALLHQESLKTDEKIHSITVK